MGNTDGVVVDIFRFVSKLKKEMEKNSVLVKIQIQKSTNREKNDEQTLRFDEWASLRSPSDLYIERVKETTSSSPLNTPLIII
jgi:hypothetical protein